MLDVGFSELALIVVAGLVLIKPQDLPGVIRQVVKAMRELRAVYTGIRMQMDKLVEEAGVSDLRKDMTTIIDLEGKPQQAYDVSELEALRAPVPPPIGGRLGGGLSGSEVGSRHAEQAPPPPQPSPCGGGSDPAPEEKPHA